jgi:hypothetical protein
MRGRAGRTLFSHEARDEGHVAKLDTEVRRAGDQGASDECDAIGCVVREVGVRDRDCRRSEVSTRPQGWEQTHLQGVH